MALTKQEKEELFNDLLHFLSQSSTSVEDLKEVQNLGEINSLPAYKKDTKELVTIPTSTLTKASEDANHAAQQAMMAGATADRAAREATSAANSIYNLIEQAKEELKTTVNEEVQSAAEQVKDNLDIYNFSSSSVTFDSTYIFTAQEKSPHYRTFDGLLKNYSKLILGSFYFVPPSDREPSGGEGPSLEVKTPIQYVINQQSSVMFLREAVEFVLTSSPVIDTTNNTMSFNIANIKVERTEVTNPLTSVVTPAIEIRWNIQKTVEIKLSGDTTTLEEINSTEITDLKF